MEGREHQISYVYNAEPEDYSQDAIKRWEDGGFSYVAGSWTDFLSFSCRDLVKVLIVRLGKKVDATILDEFPALDTIISATTGISHLDIDAIRKRNIRLINLRGQDEFLKTVPSTAELTWCMLLSIVRKVPAALEHVRQGGWNRNLFRGFQLKGKRIGIIGMGRIGSMIAQYAQAFNMDVAYCDRAVERSDLKRYSSIREMAKNSDILSIHVHPEPENLKLISSDILKCLPANAIVLNSSRGEVWDEEALLKALKEDRIAAIGADVIIHELTDREKSPIWQNRHDERVFLTPHIGGACYDAMWDCELFTQELFFRYADLY